LASKSSTRASTSIRTSSIKPRSSADCS
jgi:hypothetical protein